MINITEEALAILKDQQMKKNFKCVEKNFKSIEVQKHQIKFKTVNGSEGTIKLHTDENEVRNVREEFQNVNIIAFFKMVDPRNFS